MAGNSAMKVKYCDDIVWRVIDGEVVILSPGEVSLSALTGCGGRVWELIAEEPAISEIVQRICAEYEVEPHRASQDITEFIHKLAAMKFVEMVPAAIAEVSS